jgi:hypothetical protein
LAKDNPLTYNGVGNCQDPCGSHSIAPANCKTNSGSSDRIGEHVFVVQRRKSDCSIEMWKGMEVRNKSLWAVVAQLFPMTSKTTAKQLKVKFGLSDSNVTRTSTIGIGEEEYWECVKGNLNDHIKASAANKRVTIAVYLELV